MGGGTRPLASAPLAAPLPRRSEAEPFRNSRGHGLATVVLWSVPAFLLQTPGEAPPLRRTFALPRVPPRGKESVQPALNKKEVKQGPAASRPFPVPASLTTFTLKFF